MKRRCRILLVEDEVLFAELVAEKFQRDGYEIHTVHSAEDGLQALKDNPAISLVISDYSLQDGPTGSWLLDQIKKQGSKVAFILMTGNVVNRNEFLEKGALAVFEKPFKIAELVEFVKSHPACR